MRWLVSVLGVGLVLVGCSTTEERTAPTPPPRPAASRALVAWAETTCTQVTELDNLRGRFGELAEELKPSDSFSAGAAAESYVSGAVRSVDAATAALTKLTPSGIKAADTHVTGLVKALAGLRPKLPPAEDTTLIQAPDAEKIAKAKEVGAAVATLKPQQPALRSLAGKTPKLLSSYNLAPACTPVTPRDNDARALVAWSTAMCDSTTSLLALDTDPLGDPTLTTPGFTQFAEIQLAQYLASSAYPVSTIADQLDSAPSIGVKEADEYRAGLLAAVRAALPKLPKDDHGGIASESQPIEELKTQAVQVADILKSIQPEPSALATAVAADPELSNAYKLAPACEPPEAAPTELPTAANGTDVTACQSGKCQIQLTGATDVTVSGLAFRITVTTSGVNVTTDSSLMQLSAQGEGSFGSGDTNVTIKVLGLLDTTAVLDISTS